MNICINRLALILMIPLLYSIGPSVPAQITFTNSIDTHQIYGLGQKHAALFFDADNDGDLDVFLSSRGGQSRLYRNDNGAYLNVTVAAGLGEQTNASGAVAADYNNDGFVDICAIGSSYQIQLWKNNGDFTFTDVTAVANLTDSTEHGLSFIDYDNDQFVDLICYSGDIILYRNNGDGSFTRLDSTQTGMRATGALLRNVTAIDYDEDGLMDIFSTAVYNQHSRLWRQRADGSFVDQTQAANLPEADWEAGGWADINNDLLPDLCLTNEQRSLGLFLNNGDGTFTDISSAFSPAASGHTCNFGDFDNDGFVDVFVAFIDGANALFHNNGDGTFTDIASTVGVAGGLLGQDGVNGTTVADFNDDGKLDIYIPGSMSSNILFENKTNNTNHWVKFRTSRVFNGVNASGIGMKVVVTAGSYQGARWGHGGGGTRNPQNNLELHFGLGAEAVIDKVEVYAQGELKYVEYNLPVDQTYNLGPPCEESYGCFVDRQYADLLEREPASGERQAQLDALCTGSLTMPGLAQNLLNSSEFSDTVGFIYRCYFGLFNDNFAASFERLDYRVPDLGGVAYWLGLLRSYDNLRDGQLSVVAGFTNSIEWQQRVGNLSNEEFVEFLYRSILGRPSEPAGKQAYLDNLNSGAVTSDSLALDFLLSGEAVTKYHNQTVIAAGYLGLLKEELARSQFVDLLRRMASGALDTTDVLWIFMFGSPDYQDRLADRRCELPLSKLSAVSFDQARSSASESSGLAQLAVSISHPPLSTVTVDYAVTGGNARGGGVDYTLSSGTLTFNVGQPLPQSIPLSLIDDSIGEPLETVIVTLANPSANALIWPLTQHVFTINNDDAIEQMHTAVRGALWQLYR